MKRLFAAALALVVSTGCQSAGKDIDDHWSFRSVPPRAARAILGYDANRDGSYRDFQWRRKQDVNMALRRHFLNNNPENPFQTPDPSLYEGRPVHSILPNPAYYIHLEGLLIGWAATGGFAPIPIDSILGTAEPGGGEEFLRGIEATVTGKGVITASDAQSLYAERIEQTANPTRLQNPDQRTD